MINYKPSIVYVGVGGGGCEWPTNLFYNQIDLKFELISLNRTPISTAGFIRRVPVEFCAKCLSSRKFEARIGPKTIILI